MANCTCPRCGSNNIDFQIITKGTVGSSKTKKRMKEYGHGCLWWLFIGWWWWAVDLMLWIGFFPFRLVAEIVKRSISRRRFKGTDRTVSSSHNITATVALCKDCGNSWEV